MLGFGLPPNYKRELTFDKAARRLQAARSTHLTLGSKRGTVMRRSLPLLILFVCASVAGASQVTFEQKPGSAYYAGGVGVTTPVLGGGYIHFYTGGLVPGLVNGAQFSGGQLSFGLPLLGTAWTANFSGTWTQVAGALYQVSGTFSGTTKDGLPFTGRITQFFKVKSAPEGYSLSSGSGTTVLTMQDQGRHLLLPSPDADSAPHTAGGAVPSQNLIIRRAET
jgi:hypothetical protein